MNLNPASLLRAAPLAVAILCLPTSMASAPLQQSFDMRVPVAPAPLRTGDATRLIYELHLANFADEALTLQRVRILDSADFAIGDLHAAEIEQRLGQSLAGTPAAQTRTIASGRRAVIHLELAIDSQRPPRALRHRVDYAVAGRAGNETAFVEGAAITVDTSPVLVIDAPVRGGPWAAIHDPSWPRGHRRVLYAIDGSARIPGRHAIDWIKLDADGKFSGADNDRVDTWYGYGEEVLAVADGVIASTRDDMTEAGSVAANTKHGIADASGNYISLELARGRFAFYEHLKPGSVRVKPGQRVRRGQVLAALGFTGDSTGPHLHFHIADTNSPLGAEGVPYVLRRFDVLGRYETLDAFGSAKWKPADAGSAGRRSSEWPDSNMVVEFAE